MANVATREYVFITSRQGMALTKMGANAWLTIAVALVEIMITIKHGRGMFEALGRHMLVFWFIFLVCTAVWLVRWQLQLRTLPKRE